MSMELDFEYACVLSEEPKVTGLRPVLSELRSDGKLSMPHNCCALSELRSDGKLKHASQLLRLRGRYAADSPAWVNLVGALGVLRPIERSGGGGNAHRIAGVSNEYSATRNVS